MRRARHELFNEVREPAFDLGAEPLETLLLIHLVTVAIPSRHLLAGAEAEEGLRWRTPGETLECVPDPRRCMRGDGLAVGCDSKVKMFSFGELPDAELHSSTELLLFDLVSDQAAERVADGANEGHRMRKIRP